MQEHLRPQTFEWYKSLIEIPSHTYAKDDVEAALHFYDALMGTCGMRSIQLPAQDERFANHRLYLNPYADENGLGTCLVGHIDTVFPRDTGFLDFKSDRQKVYGPGVLDFLSTT